MSDISRERIEERIRQLIEQERVSIDEISLDDLTAIADFPEVDLKNLFTELGSLKTEVKQMNRLDKTRIDALKGFLDDEKQSKKQLLESVGQIARRSEELRSKSLILSIIEVKDFVEKFDASLAGLFGKRRHPLSYLKYRNDDIHAYFNQNVGGILKKIDAILAKENIDAIETDFIPFDPALMTAVETTWDDTIADNRVVETLVGGYLRQPKEVIRYAQVRVNKKPNTGDHQ
ncbi:MAG: nucleotide exchange factor GrpE [Proteobacteria bacterium]|nr:nucleotide exchange factor GrpE [Pseudomonadota bacterium]